jgi:hypothetical protein
MRVLTRVASCHDGIATEKNPNGLAATMLSRAHRDLHFHFPDINFWSLFSYRGRGERGAGCRQPGNARFADIEYAILKKICEIPTRVLRTRSPQCLFALFGPFLEKHYQRRCSSGS